MSDTQTTLEEAMKDAMFRAMYMGEGPQPDRFVPLRRYVRFGTNRTLFGESEPLAVATGEMFFDRETGQVGVTEPLLAIPLRAFSDSLSPWALNMLFAQMDASRYLDPILVAPTRNQILDEMREGGELEFFADYDWGTPHLLFQQGSDFFEYAGERTFWYPVLRLPDLEAYHRDRNGCLKGLGPANRKIAVFDEGSFVPDADAWARRTSGDEGIAVVVTRTMGKGDRPWRASGIAGGSLANNPLFDFGLLREARNMGAVNPDAPVTELHYAQVRWAGDARENRSTAVPAGEVLAWGFPGKGEFISDGTFVHIDLACEPGRGPLGEESLETQRNRALKVVAKDGRFSLEPIAYVLVTQRTAQNASDVGAHISYCPMSDIAEVLVGDLTPYPYEEWHFPTAEERRLDWERGEVVEVSPRD